MKQRSRDETGRIGAKSKSDENEQSDEERMIVSPRMKLTIVMGTWNVPITGLAVYVLMSMFYVFAQGSPQPADILLFGLIGVTVVLVWPGVRVESTLYAACAVFAAWVIIVNISWYLTIGDPRFLRSTLFYIYNIFVLLFVVAVARDDYERLVAYVARASAAALVFQAAYLGLLSQVTHVRPTGTFNNPNQMGYWALLLITALGIIRQRRHLTTLDLVGLAAGLYVIIRSLSKAASISAGVLVALIVLTCRWRRSQLTLVAAAGIILGGAQLAGGDLVGRMMAGGPIDALIDRLSGIGEQEDDNPAARGYTRLLENPEYLAFGAGEGAYHRLTYTIRPTAQEFHSSIGNLLMSYGIVGLTLFFLLLWVVFARTSLATKAFIVPIMLYGLTHMGLRDSLFWIVLGLAYAQTFEGEQIKSARDGPIHRPRMLADGSGDLPRRSRG